MDLLSEGDRDRVTERHEEAVPISAVRGEGLDALLERVAEEIPRFPVRVSLLVPYGREDVRAMLHRDAEVSSEEHMDEGTLIHARVGERELVLVRQFLVEREHLRIG